MLVATLLGAAACTALPPAPDDGGIAARLQRPARIMWIAAHPDDESMASPLLAYACVKRGLPCAFFVFTAGDGGECNMPGGCKPSLAAVRRVEMARAAALYGARLTHLDYFNAPLPFASFPSRPELLQRWFSAPRDPLDAATDAVVAFRPDILITLGPDHGFTGHPEHQAAARIALAAARAARDRGAPVEAVYQVLNRHPVLSAVLGRDPQAVTDVFDGARACPVDGRELTCRELGLLYTHAHRSQHGDMEGLRRAGTIMDGLYLHRLNPADGEADAAVTEVYAARARARAAH